MVPRVAAATAASWPRRCSAAQHPFKALIAHAAVYDNYAMYGGDYGAENEPLLRGLGKARGIREILAARPAPRNFKTPTLVIHGQLDQRVPLNNGMELFQILQNNAACRAGSCTSRTRTTGS